MYSWYSGHLGNYKVFRSSVPGTRGESNVYVFYDFTFVLATLDVTDLSSQDSTVER